MNSIRQRRLDHGYTLEQLALMINVDKSTISLWENGKREPKVNAMIRMADIFGCGVSDLMSPFYGENDNRAKDSA